ncbi:MFS transporter [Spongiivirga sp. MCCC 1A20706]|uniref:MFS transporter n=1 Tax=Spongiivirga sp. MCCC 1A20706 TaxID=3160963 RepID=UPI003977A438
MRSLYLILSKFRYFSPAWVFTSLNILIATWVLYIPTIKDKLSLDDGQVGIALFCLAAGTISMVPFSSKIIKQIGLGKSTFVGIVIFSLVFLLPFMAPSYILLCLTLYIVGLFACLTDVAMNALVSEIESDDEVHFMSAAHGFFSLGGVIGAGIGTLVITYFKIPLHHMLAASLLVIITNMLLLKNYIAIKGKQVKREKNKFNIKLLRPLLGLTIIAFLIMGGEGAVEHWSKLYLLDIVQVSTDKIAGYGFVAFSVTMTLGRFFGDAISSNFGARKLIIASCLIAIVGLLCVLFADFVFAIIGFALIGLGFSVVIPELFRLAGKAKGVSPSEGISFVAGFGYVGFLVSPAFLGWLSKQYDLSVSFMAILVGVALAMLIMLFFKRTF